MKHYKSSFINNIIFAMMIAKQNKYILVLKRLEATSAAKSINFQEYGIRKSLVFNTLLRQGVIQTFNNRYYLDLIKEEEQRRRRQAIIIMLLILIISAMIISIITIDYLTGGRILMIEKW